MLIVHPWIPQSQELLEQISDRFEAVSWRNERNDFPRIHEDDPWIEYCWLKLKPLPHTWLDEWPNQEIEIVNYFSSSWSKREELFYSLSPEPRLWENNKIETISIHLQQGEERWFQLVSRLTSSNPMDETWILKNGSEKSKKKKRTNENVVERKTSEREIEVSGKEEHEVRGRTSFKEEQDSSEWGSWLCRTLSNKNWRLAGLSLSLSIDDKYSKRERVRVGGCVVQLCSWQEGTGKGTK